MLLAESAAQLNRAGLAVSGLCAGYGAGAPVLDGLSFTLPAGRFLAVAGPSGVGKTTLLNVLAGVAAPRGGELLFGGAQLSPKACAIGLIPQGCGLLPWQTVRQNCLYCAKMRGAVEEADLLALCERLGIGKLLGRWPRSLSGGQAQRVALARAFLMKPRLLLMDEPFAALDVAAAQSARALCLELWRECGSTAVAVTHRLEEAMFLANSVAVMGRGGRFTFVCENPWQGLEDCDDPGARALLRRLRAEVCAAAAEPAPPGKGEPA